MSPEHEIIHLNHEIIEIRARHRMFLREILAPLLSDAVDAFEIGAPDVALRRVKAALSTTRTMART